MAPPKIDTTRPHAYTVNHSGDGDGFRAACRCGYASKAVESPAKARERGNAHLDAARKAVAKAQEDAQEPSGDDA